MQHTCHKYLQMLTMQWRVVIKNIANLIALQM
jgi:hypothetical protein